MTFKTMLFLIGMLLFLSCQTEKQITTEQQPIAAIIPLPHKIIMGNGSFTLDQTITINSSAQETFKAIDYLSDWLESTFNQRLASTKTNANLSFLTDTKMAPESYRLSISPQNIQIVALDEAGFFYGTISLIQLIAQNNLDAGPISLPLVEIEDQPAFSYRGMHLDVARHFFPPDFVKQYIDMLALYKMNRFHWHLTEDQGWRIEIKKYPKLQEIAAYRKETLLGHYSDQPHQFDGKRYGGYYTQEEVKEIVAYAADRCITIIPEIEMPGHSRAALAAYPELGCADGPYEVATKWGIFEEVYCPTEATFEFLENVLTEVMELFPSEFIHIGGDECPKTAWKNSDFCQALMKKEGLKDENELQSYFIRRMEKFLNNNGRNIIGWDEILEGGLAPNATVMSWRGESGGIEAAKEKHNVIMTPTSHCYFDYYQSDNAQEPLAIGGFLPLEKVYGYHPIPEELSAAEAQYILGVQANLWTEYIPTTDQAEYMAYPRAMALAEIGWTDQSQKDFNDFVTRLLAHYPWWKKMDINAANHLYDVQTTIRAEQAGQIFIDYNNTANLGEIRYAINASPTAQSTLAESSIPIKKSGTYTAQCFIDGQATGYAKSVSFDLHKASGKVPVLREQPSPTYSAGGAQALTNGILGDNNRYGDQEWLGFAGKNFEAIIDLGENISIESIDLRFFNGKGQWIYPPKSVKISLGSEQDVLSEIIEKTIVDSADKIIPVNLTVQKTGRYLKVQVERFGIIPEGRQGAGNEAWLFIDEIVVR